MEANATRTTARPLADTHLWMAILATFLLPALYASFRVRLLNLSLDPQPLGIIAQLQWLPLLFEIPRDSLLLLLAFHLGHVINDSQRFTQRLVNAAWLTAACYLVIAVLISLFAMPLLQALSHQQFSTQSAASYLRLEAWSQLPIALVSILQAALVAKGRIITLYILSIAQLMINAALDAWLIPLAGQGNDTQILWAALPQGLTACLLLTAMAFFIPRHQYWRRPGHDGLQIWLRRSGLAAIECLMRNAVFAWMVVRLINQSGHGTLFWNANNLIWNWLLLPVLALGLVLRRASANQTTGHIVHPQRYLVAIGLIAMLWLASRSFWEGFISVVIGAAEPQQVASLAGQQCGFYLAFALSHLISQHFLGQGRSGLILLQSSLVNMGYYGAAWLSWNAGWWQPSLDNVISLFGYGMVLGTCIMLLLYRWHGHCLKKGQRTPF